MTQVAGENVFFADYEFPLDMPKHLQPYMPNIYFTDTEPKDCLMHTLLLIAARDIKDEELFLNYHFNESNRLPVWYTTK